MEIVLKKNWDVPISVPGSYDQNEGYFAGRKMEVELLKNDILRKDQGSILISGHRGVGKTSLIYKSLHEVFNEMQNRDGTNEQIFEKALNTPNQNSADKVEKKLLLILINAGQFSYKSEQQEDGLQPEIILKTLVRRLYATGQSHDLGMFKPDLENLYKKAISKEYKLQESLLYQMEQLVKSNQSKTSIFKLKGISLKIVIQACSFLVGAFFIYFNPFTQTFFNKLFGLLMTLPIPFLINYTIVKEKQHSKSKLSNQTAKLLYQLDNNVANLEYDLEEIHKKMNCEGWKIVYVIDELDKLGDAFDVSKVIKYFKNLFTLSKAIFIFIGNEDMYKLCTSEYQGDNFRPEQFTYFTSKYFIPRPTWSELVEFMDSSMRILPDKPKNGVLLQLQHYLAQESQNDFFSLINIIKDNICSYDSNGFPILSVDMANAENIKKSRMHKCQMILFDQKYYIQSLAHRFENEQLLRHLIKYSIEILNSSRELAFVDPIGTDNIAALTRDFNSFLAKLGVFSITVEGKAKINDVELSVRRYSYNSYFKSDPPDKLNILSETENRFIGLSNSYLEEILPIVNFQGSSDEFEYTFEELRNNIENGKDLSSLLHIDWLIPESTWEYYFKSLCKGFSSIEISREIVESQIESLTQKLSQVNSSLLRLVFDIIKRHIGPGYISYDDQQSWDMRKARYFHEELYKAYLEGDILICRHHADEREHLLLNYYSPLIDLLKDLPADHFCVYVIVRDTEKFNILHSSFADIYQIDSIASAVLQAKKLLFDIKDALIMTARHEKAEIHEVLSLNDREIEFLRLACTEMTYKEISERMFISARTVDGYRDTLFEKLNVRSRVGLVMFALKHGIVQG